MHQASYVPKIEPLGACSDYEAFRYLLHKLAWLGHTRPDIVAPVNIMSQVTADRLDETHLKTINMIVRRAKAHEDRGLTQHKSDEENVRVVVFADSYFANNTDSSTQLGYIILLMDHSYKANCLFFTSYK